MIDVFRIVTSSTYYSTNLKKIDGLYINLFILLNIYLVNSINMNVHSFSYRNQLVTRQKPFIESTSTNTSIKDQMGKIHCNFKTAHLTK